MSINWINNKYLASNNVKVYPSAYRGTNDSNIQIDPKAVLNLEENIIKSSQAGFPGAKSENSYIISWVDGLLKCVIAGYYFEITGVNKADIDESHRYATVRLRPVTIADGTETSILSPIDGPGNTSTNADPGATMILDIKFGNDYAFIGLAFVNEIKPDVVGLDLLAAESNYKLSHTDILSNLKNNTTSSNIAVSITGNIVDGTGDLSTASLYEESGAQQNTATGIGAHARGYHTTASGSYSHAEGYLTTASGNYSHAEGLVTKAVADNSLAIGKYNIGKNDTLFEIGCGDSNLRKNAFEVTASAINLTLPTHIKADTEITGTATIYGDVTATATGSISLEGQYITLATPELLLGDAEHSKTIAIEQSGITITGPTTIEGTITSNDKLTVSTGGAALAGDVAINGKLTVGPTLEVASSVTGSQYMLKIKNNGISYGTYASDTYFNISSVSGNPKLPEYGVRTNSQRIDKCILGFDSRFDGEERVSNWAEFNSAGYCTYASRDSEASKKQTGKIPSADLNNICYLTELNSDEVAKRPTGSNAICPRLIVGKITIPGNTLQEVNLSNQGINSILGVWLTEERAVGLSGNIIQPRFAIEGYTVKVHNPATDTRTFSILVIAW